MKGLWVIVPAAGIGKRMNIGYPKQYLPLGRRTVIEVTLKKLFSVPEINNIIIVLSKNDKWWTNTTYAADPRILSVLGGNERSSSVLNALKLLAKKANNDDWVMIHDAVRPCVKGMDIKRLIRYCKEKLPHGAVLSMLVRDTIKRSDHKKRYIISTVQRNDLWHILTPQIFQFGLLIKSMEIAFQSGAKLTDESSVMELAGYKVMLIEGESSNIKITYPTDLALAENYLKIAENK